MGFFDRFKKKKKAKEAAKEAPVASAAAPAAAPKKEMPTDPVGKAFYHAREVNEANLSAGKYNKARAALFEAMLAASEGADAPDDAKLLDVAQIIGSMNRAARTA